MPITVKQLHAQVAELRTDINRVQEAVTSDREPLRDALRKAHAALNGDSNDAEHDALVVITEAVADFLGIARWTPANEI